MKVIWKDIQGYEGYYQISNTGFVLSLPRKSNSSLSVLKPQLSCHGYPQVGLKVKGKGRKLVRIHRLVALHFIPNPENKPEVNHINRNRADYRIENLEWCTRTENARHAAKLGSFNNRSGQRGSHAKIKDSDVPLIMEMIKSKSLIDIGKFFNVYPSGISRIVTGKTFKNVPRKIPYRVGRYYYNGYTKNKV